MQFEACSLLSADLHPSDALNRATKQKNFLWSQINSLAIGFKFGILRWSFSLISAQTGNIMRESATHIKGQAEHVLAFNEQCVWTITAGLVRGWRVRRKMDCLKIASKIKSIKLQGFSIF